VSLPSPFRARPSVAAEPAAVPVAPASPLAGRACRARRAARPGAALAVLALLGAISVLAGLSACGVDRGGSNGAESSAPGAAASVTASSTGPVASLVPGSVLAAPLGCPAGIGVLVLQRLAVRMSHDYTAVVARCDAAAGSPPTGVFVVAGGGAAASVHQTLVRSAQQLQVSALTATSSGVQVRAAGYSRADVPRCCPDLSVTLTWRTVGDRLVLVP